MEGDIASHLFHQLLGDHQPQARSAVTTGNARIGLAESLDASGALMVRDDAGELHRVLSGDVSVRGIMGYV